MKKVQKMWFPDRGMPGGNLTREKLIHEIRRIKRSKTSVTDKITAIRQLVEQYFKIESNEELLNANLPFA